MQEELSNENMCNDSLSKEQAIAMDRFYHGENIFLTGPAGTGKSFLIEAMVQSSTQQKKKVQVCAMTGVAAILLGNNAQTLHSWSGIKMCKDTPEVTAQKVNGQLKYRKKWKGVDVLIVDEVSMMSVRVFDTLIETARLCRSPYQRKIQFVFIGDMFQLPPVGIYAEETTPCYHSLDWWKTFPVENHIEMKYIFRQKDPTYVTILNQVREGTLDEASLEILRKCIGKETGNKTITRFYPTRSQVERINREEFALLPSPIERYVLEESTNLTVYVDTGLPIAREDRVKGKSQEWELLNMKKNYSEELLLRVGAAVMCTSNLDMELGIVNGSQGRIVEITDPQRIKVFEKNVTMRLPVVVFSNGQRMTMKPKIIQSTTDPTVGISQLPLILCWAMTIHKSQGATLDAAMMDLGKTVFEYGQTYVALSRVKTMDGLYLQGLDPSKIRANPDVKEFYSKIRGHRAVI